MATSPSRLLLHRIALLAFVAFVAVGIWLRDVEALAFGIALLVGVFLLPIRKGLLGRIVLAAAFLDVALWMTPAAFSNARHDSELISVALPVGLAAVAIAGLLAAVGLGGRVVTPIVVSAAVIAIALSQLPWIGSEPHVSDEIRLSAKGVRFDRSRITVTSMNMGFVLDNKDLFWHTLTIDKLHVNIRVPLRARRSANAGIVKPGRYEYYCAIPGHKTAGMKGTLVVR